MINVFANTLNLKLRSQVPLLLVQGHVNVALAVPECAVTSVKKVNVLKAIPAVLSTVPMTFDSKTKNLLKGLEKRKPLRLAGSATPSEILVLANVVMNAISLTAKMIPVSPLLTTQRVSKTTRNARVAAADEDALLMATPPHATRLKSLTRSATTTTLVAAASVITVAANMLVMLLLYLLKRLTRSVTTSKMAAAALATSAVVNT